MLLEIACICVYVVVNALLVCNIRNIDIITILPTWTIAF